MKCLYTFYYICSLNAIGANILYDSSFNRGLAISVRFSVPARTSADRQRSNQAPATFFSSPASTRTGFIAFFKNMDLVDYIFENYNSSEIMCE
ncbi:MAG: hypothetical protein U5L72_19610 [Bacteroidales bacterium]|nr:hypothetical protein [Bacteroidales bacterium]